MDVIHVGRGETDDWFYYVMELADAVPSPKSDDGGSKVEAGEAQADSILPPPSFIPIAAPSILTPGSSARAVEEYRPLTLSALVHANGRLPVPDCVRLGLALTSALDHLHRHKLVHRDIKPANIIFLKGQPKLADVGLVTDTSETVSWVGTPGFVPPEGLGSGQADLYALGKVIHAASTGHRGDEPLNPLTGLEEPPDQSEWLEPKEIVDRACDPNPKRRYASAAEMRADLALLDAGESPSTRRLWKKRVQQAGWALAGAAVLVGLVLSVQYLSLRGARRGRALLELEKLIRPPHEAGWSSKA